MDQFGIEKRDSKNLSNDYLDNDNDFDKCIKNKKTTPNRTDLVFTGDIGFDNYMTDMWKDEDLLDDTVLDFIHASDHVIINVEGPLYIPEVTGDRSGVAQLKHGMNPEVAFFFDRIGADVWNICNNHIMDNGPDGMEATLNEAKKHNVKTLGAGRNIFEASEPVFFDEAGGIGMIGVGYQRACRKASEDIPGCLSWSDMERISNQIKLIKSKCRWCIVVAHGGEEFTALPAPYTRKRYIDYLNMGADVVVSHHPHVPLNYELFPEKAIFYSLGNFIFDTNYQRSQFNTEKGVVLKISFDEEGFSFDSLGIRVNRENEHIESDKLPDIFTEVNEEEYDKLIPLAAQMFLENTKRQLRYLFPDKFKNATDEDWYNNFYEPLRSGRVPGEVLDLQIIYPLAKKADEGKWKESNLEKVKQYILDQL